MILITLNDCVLAPVELDRTARCSLLENMLTSLHWNLGDYLFESCGTLELYEDWAQIPVGQKLPESVSSTRLTGLQRTARCGGRLASQNVNEGGLAALI